MKPTVLYSVRKPDETTNPYIVSLADAVAADLELVFFNWRTALIGQFHVFHVHWPEQVFRAKKRMGFLKGCLAWLFLLRLVFTRRPVVWTVHNVRPHETGGFLERSVLRMFERIVKHRIYLAEPSHPMPQDQYTVIPHGHYKEWYAKYPRSSSVKSRYLLCGLMRPYKGVEMLISAFRSLQSAEVSLVLAGKPAGTMYGETLVRLAEADDRIKLRLGYLTDRALVEEVTAAELLVLPYRNMGNSGVLLMALSLNRPVLMPKSAMSDFMKRIVGNEWIHTYVGELSDVDRKSTRLNSSHWE